MAINCEVGRFRYYERGNLRATTPAGYSLREERRTEKSHLRWNCRPTPQLDVGEGLRARCPIRRKKIPSRWRKASLASQLPRRREEMASAEKAEKMASAGRLFSKTSTEIGSGVFVS
jgi:hypothetical protein